MDGDKLLKTRLRTKQKKKTIAALELTLRTKWHRKQQR